MGNLNTDAPAEAKPDVNSPAEVRKTVWRFGLGAAFATSSYQIIQGGVMVMYLNRLGFDEKLIGLVALLCQLPAVLQLWAARHVDRRGCRRFMLSAFLLGPPGIIAVALAPQIESALGWNAMAIAIVSGLMCYCLAQAMAATSWMPMLRHNVPISRSTQLIGRMNQISMAGGVMVTGTALLFLKGHNPPLIVYSEIIALGAALFALRAAAVWNARDTEPQVEDRTAGGHLLHDALAVLKDRPFRRLMIFVFISNFGALLVAQFRPLYCKSLMFGERFTGLVTVPLVLASFGISTYAWGKLADRFGSRSIYLLAGGGVVAAQIILALPSGNSAADVALLIAGIILVQACWAGVDAANNRRAFTIVPQRNQTLYMVGYQFAIGVPLGLAPLIGGLTIDRLRGVFQRHPSTLFGAAAYAPYHVLFIISAAFILVAVLYSRRMRDLRETSTPRLLLYLRLRAMRTVSDGMNAAAAFFRIKLDDE